MTTYKRHKVIMLLTNEKAAPISFDETNNWLYKSHNQSNNYQHLYILSDEEIKEGDWYLFNVGYASGIKQATLDDVRQIQLEINPKKVIATTDTSLLIKSESEGENSWYNPLPNISQSFIEKYVEEYNKGNIITDVMVECLEYEIGFYGMLEEPQTDFKVKVNSSNEISIKL